jgi:hypothetical protein
MRYLFGSADDQLVAYAPGRRDFYSAADDALWAHNSHDWLIAAATGKTLAHRTKGIYYSVTTGEPLYYEGPGRSTADRAGPVASPRTGSGSRPRQAKDHADVQR